MHRKLLWFQGRCVWHNPVEKAEDDFEEEEEEEEKEDVEEPKPESGPQLLTSIAEDEGRNINNNNKTSAKSGLASSIAPNLKNKHESGPVC